MTLSDKPNTSDPADGNWIAHRLFTAEVIIAAGLLLLSGIFLALNMNVGIWADEAHTLKYANPNNSFVENFKQFAPSDAHPPFYPLALYVWAKILPYGEISARIFGVAVAISIFIFVLVDNIIDDRRIILRFYLLLFSCFFVLFYLVEIRSYSLLISLSSLSAIGLYRLASNSDDNTQIRSAKYYLIISLFLMTAAHVWGFLFSAAIIATLPLAKHVRFDFKFIGVCALAVLLGSPGIIFVAYQILSNAALGDDLLRFINSDLIGLKLLGTMIVHFTERFLVTTSSKIIFLIALAALLYFGSWRQLATIKCLLLPVVFLVLGISAISLFVGSIYRAYAMVIFIPYIFLILSIVVSSPRINKFASLAILLGFAVANYGSVPFFDGLPDKPLKIGKLGETSAKSPRP